MAVCNGLNSHALRPGSIYTGGTSDTLMELKVTQRHLGHCNMPLLSGYFEVLLGTLMYFWVL